MTVKVSNIQKQILLAAKSSTADALAMFRPNPAQEEFFRTFSMDSILEIMLGGGNRAGKSLCAAVAMASCLLNRPITFHDGTQIIMRPERWRHEKIKVWIVGFDWDHLGKTIYRLLFEPGSFRIIKDQDTGKWRTWNPKLPGEMDIKFTRPAPALIKFSDIIGGEAGMSWENKKEHQCNSFELKHDGTRVEMFPSTGAKPQGDPAHVIWLDERINDENWYSELLARLMDHRGRLLWTMWADTAPCASMAEACERAALQAGEPNQKTFAFQFKGGDNPFITGEHRDAILATMDEDTRAARADGVMNMNRWRVYAAYSRFVHRALTNDPVADEKDPLAKAIRAQNGIPADWTRYLILDPGTARPGVLMVAVPPPRFGDYIVPYDELYMPYTSAKPLAEAIAAKTKGTFFEDFIIDAHAARQTPMGFDGTIGSNYEKEFLDAKLRCNRRGAHFSFGSDNIEGRILKLQGFLNIRHDGSVKIRIHGCPNLCKQLEQYRWENDKGQPSSKPAKRQHIDVATCLEYFVSRSDCGYVRPPKVQTLDKKSAESVRKAIGSLFSAQPKPTETSVYIGAGERPII